MGRYEAAWVERAPQRGRWVIGWPAGWMAAYALGGLLLWAVYAQGAFLEPAKTIVAVGIPALGLLHFLLRRYRCQSQLAWVALDRLFLALAALGALSATWSIAPAKSLRAAAILLGGCFVLRLGRELGLTSPTARRRLFLMVGLAGTAVSLAALVGYLLPPSRFSLVHDGRLVAIGTLGYANALAAFLVLTLAATAAFVLDEAGEADRQSARPWVARLFRHRAGRLVFPAAGAALQITALALTRSRAVAGIAVVLLLLFLILRLLLGSGKHVWRDRAAGLVLAALLLCVLAYGVSLWLGQFRPWGPMTADVFRVNTWRAALEAAVERPVFGYGLDTFYQAYAPFKQGALTSHAHNLFVQQLVETGVVGTALLLAFLLVAILRPLRSLTGRLRNPQIPLALGAAAFVLLNLVDLAWYFPALLFLFSLFLGLVDSYDRRLHGPVTTTAFPGRIAGKDI